MTRHQLEHIIRAAAAMVRTGLVSLQTIRERLVTTPRLTGELRRIVEARLELWRVG
jgi:hypothetical protein